MADKNLNLGRCFLLDGGDGGKGFFDSPWLLKEIERPWFSGAIWNQKAHLFEVTNAESEYDYIALLSRWTTSFNEQVDKNNAASVIVFGLKTKKTGRTIEYIAESLGMSFVEKKRCCWTVKGSA